MSLQAGVMYMDTRPMNRELNASIVGYLQGFPLDSSSCHSEPGLFMAYRGLHVTAADAIDVQPFRSPRGNVLTFDGRLDNLTDLRLRLNRQIVGPMSDAALVMAAYEAWGEYGFTHLLGDWSLALWDRDAQELKLASDYLGVRALYYADLGSALHWSTSLAELVDRLDLRDELDPRYVLGKLTGGSAPLITPYRRVSSIPPAHVTTWSRSGSQRRRRFWTLEANDIRFKDQRQYESELRRLFFDAVKDRLRSTRTVWAELSGGLDSSAVVCMADCVTGGNGGSDRAVETVSVVHDKSPESDERPFIREIELSRRRAGTYVTVDSPDDLRDERWDWVSPSHPGGARLAVLSTVRQGGGRTLLTGNPGDLVMANYPEDLDVILAALADGHVGLAASLLHSYCWTSRHSLWHGLFLLISSALLGARKNRDIRHELAVRFGGSRYLVREGSDAFLLTDGMASLWRDHAIADAAASIAPISRSKRSFWNSINRFSTFRPLQTPPEFADVHYTHPYMARPLVEFMFSIPRHVAVQPGRPRLLMKRAFVDLLPLRVARRFSKGDPRAYSRRHLLSWATAFDGRLDTLHVVRRGYVDPLRLGAVLQEIRSGACRDDKNVRAIFGLEQWLSARVAQMSDCPPTRVAASFGPVT